MPEAIPSYLMAIAIGDLVFAETGPRSGVYAEPQWIEAAAAEFDVLEEMIDIGEDLYGPYRWGRYDLLVLPPSFPFGGMENPRLSYVTPTIIAGDGSLLALVAHELAHSWSGNLVTNAAWRDLWLNEGFTVYFEARIMEALYGREVRDQLAKLAWDGLKSRPSRCRRADRQLVRDLVTVIPSRRSCACPTTWAGSSSTGWKIVSGVRSSMPSCANISITLRFESISTEDFPRLCAGAPGRCPSGPGQHGRNRSVAVPAGHARVCGGPESDAFEQVDDWRERWQAGDAGWPSCRLTTGLSTSGAIF
jgi:leukotriene-A4 hydrolase